LAIANRRLQPGWRSNTNTHSYRYSHGHSHSHSHSHSNSYINAETDTYAEVCANTQTPSHTTGKTIEIFATSTIFNVPRRSVVRRRVTGDRCFS